MPEHKRLIIMRHADTANESASGKDFDRKLTDTGRKNARSSGEYLQQNNWQPDCIISSPAIRAQQTSEIVLECLNKDGLEIQYAANLYLAETDTLIAHCKVQLKKCDCVLLVAHNPGLETLAMQLASDNAKPVFLAPACLVICEEISSSLDILNNSKISFFNPRSH